MIGLFFAVSIDGDFRDVANSAKIKTTQKFFAYTVFLKEYLEVFLLITKFQQI